jgi:hypothetical protein
VSIKAFITSCGSSGATVRRTLSSKWDSVSFFAEVLIRYQYHLLPRVLSANLEVNTLFLPLCDYCLKVLTFACGGLVRHPHRPHRFLTLFHLPKLHLPKNPNFLLTQAMQAGVFLLQHRQHFVKHS